MAKRGQPCDCCGAPRLRWQRLCNACFHALPPAQRNALLDNWRRGDKRAWRGAKREAAVYLADQARRNIRTVGAQATYDRIARLTGERE